jgi:PAS domain S-box-containing protein
MAWLNLDIRTLLVLLVFGNILAVLLMAFSKGDAGTNGPRRHFITGKSLQALAWALLALRGHVPDLLSAYLGNSLLITGFALESLAFTSAATKNRAWKLVFLVLAVLGIASFWLFGSNPNRWVGLASIATATLLGTAAWNLLRYTGSSRLRTVLGLIFGVFSLILSLRAGEALLSHAEFSLLSRNLLQTASFSSSFLLMVAGVIGFPLLLKEREDQLLQESEAKFLSMFQSSPDAMLLTRLGDGGVLEVNDQFVSMTGFPAAEVLGRTTTELRLFAEASMRETMAESLRNGQRVRGLELSYRRKSGELFVGLLSAQVITIGGERVILSSVSDITDRKRLELERERMIVELQHALSDVKALSGLLPICASCKKIRDDNGYWNQLEQYITEHSEADFTHGLCPDCTETFFPGYAEKKKSTLG